MRELTIERLHEVLEYDEDHGEFRWKCAIGHKRAGAKAGTNTKDGYIYIGIDGKQYFAHRLAWAYVHGVWPETEIDHMNGVRSDNRLVNIRPASASMNRQNQRRAHRGNKYLGASKSPDGSSWRARIYASGREVYIGSFGTPEEAHQAYLAAKRKLHEGCTI